MFGWRGIAGVVLGQHTQSFESHVVECGGLLVVFHGEAYRDPIARTRELVPFIVELAVHRGERPADPSCRGVVGDVAWRVVGEDRGVGHGSGRRDSRADDGGVYAEADGAEHRERVDCASRDAGGSSEDFSGGVERAEGGA